MGLQANFACQIRPCGKSRASLEKSGFNQAYDLYGIL
jgi:hypothetical protein